MKIGFLTSYRGQKQFENEYWEIIHFLEKKGHEVVHSMDIDFNALLSLTFPEREKLFYSHFHKLETCDIVIAECSLQSTHVGIGLSYIREKGKPTIIMYEKGAPGYFSTPGDIYSEIENMMVVEYTKDTMFSTVEDAIVFMSEKLDKRFTMIFPASLMAKLEATAREKKLPKAVYIRQLLEESLKKDN